MTVPASVTTYRYQGNGVTTVFAYNNRLLSTADLQVQILTRATDAVVETLTLTTDYTVTIVSNSLANVTITNALKIPSVTQDILLNLDLDIAQTRSYPRADSLPASDIELGLDKLTLIAQLLDGKIDRSLRFPDSDTTSDGEIPSAAARASTYLAFDSNGAPIASASAAGGAPAGAFGATLVATATAGAAITALGLDVAPFLDSTAIIRGSADATKLLRIEVDGFTTATTRVLTPPNFDGTIATLAGVETLTNKTLTTAALGSSTATTQLASDNSTKVATTAFARNNPSAAKAGGTVTFSAGTPTLSAGSFGVSSITDSGTGTTTINLSVTLSGTYQVLISPRQNAVGGANAESHTATTFIVKTYTESGGSFPLADINFDFCVFGTI